MFRDSEIILKLRMLRLYRWFLRDWYRDVWKREAYSQMCCSGRECGCYGADYASMWEWMLKRKTP
jgi:hypothetical protein